MLIALAYNQIRTYNELHNKIIMRQSLRIPYAQSVHDDEETKKVLGVLREHRTNLGTETREFERKVSNLFGKKYGIMVNSGSSANLLAFDLLNLPVGSEVITPLLTFSTTLSPILMKRLIPVFADVEEGKYTININHVEKLISNKTKAIMIPLLLGNVPDLERLMRIARKHNIFFIEDSCDTIGAIFDDKPTGAYSDITTASFFGSHIITAGGNGGMIMVNNKNWLDKLKTLRGWGRASSRFNESESISKRFKTKLEGIPYDAKFIFEEVGYNFLPNEMGAAFGNAQLKKLARFKKIREHNFNELCAFFKQYERFFILPIQNPQVKTWWLAFPITIRKRAPFTRLKLTTYLEKNNVQTRPIFTGNILKHPGFKTITYKMLGKCPITNDVMESGFLIGCHQGLEKEHIERLKELFYVFLKKYKYNRSHCY